MGGATGTASRGGAQPGVAGATPSVAEATRRDLQRLLSDTVQRLRRNTNARSVVAWALHPDASPYVAAADFAEEPPVTPTRALFDGIAALPGATHLRDPYADDEVVALGRETRTHAAVPIAATGSPALAALLLDGEIGPATLAALDTAAHQVATPLATALSLGRLADLDGHVRELDRLSALGALASEVADEIRNPLNTLAEFIEVLPERREDPEFLTRYRDVILKELQRVGEILDRMTEYARPGRRGASEADLGSVLATVSELLRLRAGARKIRIDLDGMASGCTLRLAEDALRQLLFNLIHHAVEVTPAGAAVEIETRAHSREVEIEIRDAGPDLPEELAQQVFEPFCALHEGSPGGIGLAIARRIAETAGGSIAANSTPGRGTVFSVRLPRL